ncbi:MAG: hypothetical protein HYY18_09525 [Planctomycetes bacterium]|nr:hypothetical protein [Planctomycetota bacterium]
MPFNAGDTYQGRISNVHLYVVVSDPLAFPEQVVVVNISSQAEWKDQTCVLRTEDHPFIRHESVVMYGLAEVVQLKTLVVLHAQGLVNPDKPVSEEVLARIRDGFAKSRRTVRRIAAILKAQNLI